MQKLSSKVCVDRHLYDDYSVIPIAFYFALEYAVLKLKGIRRGWKLTV